jgi:predicted dehydrogenase
MGGGAAARGARDATVTATLGIGVVGTGWITRAHVHALHTLNHIDPLERCVRPVSLAGRNEERAAAAAAELGFERSTTRWEETVDDPEVDVVACLAAVPAHAQVSLAALSAGKPVLCEKPLAGDPAATSQMTEAARASGVTHACGYNYRYIPAVRLMHDVLRSGALGHVRHYRALYLQDYMARDQSGRPSHGGSGSVLDYAHIVDLLHHLVGEPRSVSAHAVSFGSRREDAYAATLELPGGGLGTLEASRHAMGWKGRQRVEVNGTEGSAWWDMEEPNRLHVFLERDEREGLGGFRSVLVTEPDHPFLRRWWTAGHVLGWEHSFTHQWRDFLEAVLAGRPVPAEQADFEDGHRAAVVCEAILESARVGRRVGLVRTPAGSAEA